MNALPASHPDRATREEIVVLRFSCPECGHLWRAESFEGEVANADRRCPKGDGFGLIVDRYDP